MAKYFKCDQCPKIYASRQGRWRHKHNDHKESSLKMKPEKMINLAESSKSSHNDGDSRNALQDIQDPVSDIPTFNGAEFCDRKPLSDETLIKIKKMLKIPRQRHATILKEERKVDKQAFEKSNSLYDDYSDEESMDESETEQAADEKDLDGEENGESDGKDMEKLEDETDTSEPDEEAPLDDTAIRNLIKRFKILHHQLIHEGRKDHVPNLLEIITILNDEGQLGDEHDRIVKSVTDYE